MARLRNEDWLAQAKRVPIGQTLRVLHGREVTPALTIGNRDDRWWAYCQRCKCGAVEMKSHVLIVPTEPPQSRRLDLPQDAKAIDDLLGYQQEFIAKFLATKNMDMLHLPPDGGTLWSEERHRLIIRTSSGYMGRDTSERSPQKWLTYSAQQWLDHLEDRLYPTAVMVEDAFSFFKVAHAARANGLPVNVYCTLGTKMATPLFLRCLEHHRNVASFYDGDAAGWAGCNSNAKRLRGVGLASPLNADNQCAPAGKDPKDMASSDIAYKLRYIIASKPALAT